jgi:hypothetical protein
MGIKRVSVILSILSLGASQMACVPGQNSGVGFEAGTKLEINPPVDPIVCDPFDDDGPSYRQNGLSGQFYYLTPEMPRYERVSEYISLGKKVDRVTLFLSRLFVPTRAFDLGFTTQNGATLKNDAGEDIYEYFGIEMTSTLMLSTMDQHIGDYQLALLSDDGATLEVQSTPGAPFEMLVDNDGTHPTRFKVSQRPVRFDGSTRLPMKLRYYQGPRFHVSMTLMWRPWPQNPSDVVDPLDGHASNSDFFDSTQVPSVEQAKYRELLSRGWKPLDTKNFLLREVLNPCGDDYNF